MAPPTQSLPPLRPSWSWIVASDPGLLRLRFAGRAALVVGLTGALLYLIQSITGLEIKSMSLAFLALFAVVMVRDPKPTEQLVTTLLGPIPAGLSFTLAALLAHWPLVADTAFLAVIFGAVSARRFGARWTALGMLAFVAFFMSQYLHPTPSQLAAQALGLATGTSMAILTRFVLLPDDPDKAFPHVMQAIKQQIALMLSRIAGAVESGEWTEPGKQRIRQSRASLAEAFLTAEEQIRLLRKKSPELHSEGLQLRLFRLELATERFATMALAGLPDRRTCKAVLSAISTLVRHLGSGKPMGGLDPDGADADHEKKGDGLSWAISELKKVLADIPVGFEQRPGRETIISSSSSAKEVDPEPSNDADEQADQLGSPGLHSATIQAIQVTAACGIAMGLGYLISGQRWYWAVITAFIVFNGASSRGDTILRSIQRLAGTVAGVVAGVLIATALSAHPYVETALVLPCIFLAFYSFQVSYAVMIFWFTIALALLYGLMGLFSPELLLVRLEETGAGAVAGMIVAAWLFPRRTRNAVEDSLRGFLRALDNVIEQSVEIISEAGDKCSPVALSRALDRSFKAAQDATGPVTFGWGVQASSLSARQLATLATCRYWARELALIAGTSGRDIGAAHADHLRGSAHDVRSRISRLQKRIEHAGVSTGLRPVEDAEGGKVGRTPIIADPTAQQQASAAALEVLSNLDAALERLALLQGGGSLEQSD